MNVLIIGSGNHAGLAHYPAKATGHKLGNAVTVLPQPISINTQT